MRTFVRMKDYSSDVVPTRELNSTGHIALNEDIIKESVVLLERAGNSFILITTNGNIELCSEGLVKITGFTSEELYNMRINDLVSKEDLDILSEGQRYALSDDDFYRTELNIVKKDGTNATVEWMAKKINNNRGNINLAVLIRDITDQIQVLRTIKEISKFNYNLIDQSPYPVIIIKRGGGIVRVNPAFERLTGYPSSELIGLKSPFPWWINQINKEKTTRDIRAATKQTGERFEELFKNKYGGLFWVEVTPTAIVTEGDWQYMMNIWVNITERKRRQKDMEYYVSKVIKAQEDERQFIACELHDDVVQNLAAVALDIGTLALSRNNNPNTVTKQLEKLRSKVDGIIYDIRRFCHSLRPHILDRMGLISALQVLADELSYTGKIRVEVDAIGKTRRLSPIIELVLFRITQEALNNVMKHANADIAEVKVAYSQDDTKLTVKDNGQGFNSEGYLNKLPSTGKLGLLGMRDRTRLVNGDFRLDSGVGKGTAITVTIPNVKTQLSQL